MSFEWPGDQNRIAEAVAQFLSSEGQDQSAKTATLVKVFQERWNSRLKKKHFVTLAAIFKDVFYYSDERLHKYKGSILKFAPNQQPSTSNTNIPNQNIENITSPASNPSTSHHQQQQITNSQNFVGSSYDLQTPQRTHQIDFLTTAGIIRNKLQPKIRLEQTVDLTNQVAKVQNTDNIFGKGEICNGIGNGLKSAENNYIFQGVQGSQVEVTNQNTAAENSQVQQILSPSKSHSMISKQTHRQNAQNVQHVSVQVHQNNNDEVLQSVSEVKNQKVEQLASKEQLGNLNKQQSSVISLQERIFGYVLSQGGRCSQTRVVKFLQDQMHIKLPGDTSLSELIGYYQMLEFDGEHIVASISNMQSGNGKPPPLLPQQESGEGGQLHTDTQDNSQVAFPQQIGEVCVSDEKVGAKKKTKKIKKRELENKTTEDILQVDNNVEVKGGKSTKKNKKKKQKFQEILQDDNHIKEEREITTKKKKKKLQQQQQQQQQQQSSKQKQEQEEEIEKCEAGMQVQDNGLAQLRSQTKILQRTKQKGVLLTDGYPVHVQNININVEQDTEAVQELRRQNQLIMSELNSMKALVSQVFDFIKKDGNATETNEMLSVQDGKQVLSKQSDDSGACEEPQN